MSDMKLQILAVAMKLAETKGYQNLTRNEIAGVAEVATGSVTYHFKSMRKLQAAVVTEAIKTENLAIVSQAVVARHPLALKCSQALKDAVARLIRSAA